MGNPIDTLDRCSAKLAQAQESLAKARKVATFASGVVVAGGFGMLLWKLLADDPEPQPEPERDEGEPDQ